MKEVRSESERWDTAAKYSGSCSGGVVSIQYVFWRRGIEMGLVSQKSEK